LDRVIVTAKVNMIAITIGITTKTPGTTAPTTMSIAADRLASRGAGGAMRGIAVRNTSRGRTRVDGGETRKPSMTGR
jgi:hypothetical protein